VEKKLRQFAITGNLPSRGKAPRKEDKKWYPVYDATRSCPLTKSKALGAGKASPHFFRRQSAHVVGFTKQILLLSSRNMVKAAQI
jgi:hypothetical protein